MVLTLGGSTGMIKYSVDSILVRYVLTRVFVLFGVFPTVVCAVGNPGVTLYE